MKHSNRGRDDLTPYERDGFLLEGKEARIKKLPCMPPLEYRKEARYMWILGYQELDRKVRKALLAMRGSKNLP